jgi:hypothetical protein
LTDLPATAAASDVSKQQSPLIIAGASPSSATSTFTNSTPRADLAAAELAAADAAEAGIILGPCYPDESYLQEEMVRIYADHGALEKHHIVYEHIEVLVNPVRVHLTAALATALQDYFKLKDDDGSRGRPPPREVKQPAPGKAAEAARTTKRSGERGWGGGWTADSRLTARGADHQRGSGGGGGVLEGSCSGG